MLLYFCLHTNKRIKKNAQFKRIACACLYKSGGRGDGKEKARPGVSLIEGAELKIAGSANRYLFSNRVLGTASLTHKKPKRSKLRSESKGAVYS